MGKHRNKLIELLDEGLLDPKQLANDLLGFLSEDDCEEFAQKNDIDLFPEDDEEEAPEYLYDTEEEVNDAFREYWDECCRDEHHPDSNDRPAKRQSFSVFVDNLQRDGSISDDLAQEVTLEGDD